MSTKSTITSGPNFHLYTDLFDPASVYLEMTGVKFESGDDWVKLAIPFAIWEVVRQYPAVDLSLAAKTDGEIRQLVESQVDRRINRYVEARERKKTGACLDGMLVYGDVSASREKQIARGWNFYMELRARQSKIKQCIAELQSMQRQSED